MMSNIDLELKKVNEQLIIKRYSRSTQKTYGSFLKHFFNRFDSCQPNQLNDDHLRLYLLELIQANKAASTQNQAVNAIKYYFEKVLGRKRKVYHLERPKREWRLPTVLAAEEVRILLLSTKNIKHKALLSVIYACGLRIGEVLRLRITDINSTDEVIHIRQAKGKKDRIVPLTPKLLALLRHYYRRYRPAQFLFEGQKGPGHPYSYRSAQQVLRRSLKVSGIKKDATLHTLRHSYATHLLTSGTNLRMIQMLLGHNSLKTTEIYTHITDVQIANVASPFDKIV